MTPNDCHQCANPMAKGIHTCMTPTSPDDWMTGNCCSGYPNCMHKPASPDEKDMIQSLRMSLQEVIQETVSPEEFMNQIKQALKEAREEGAREAFSLPALEKYQPCGCIICTCDDPQKCWGCGAKNCYGHPIGQFKNPVYKKDHPLQARISELESDLEDELKVSGGLIDSLRHTEARVSELESAERDLRQEESSQANEIEFLQSRVSELEAERDRFKEADKSTSDAYLRIRALLGAWDTNKGGENRFEVTEQAIVALKDRITELEAELSKRQMSSGGDCHD